MLLNLSLPNVNVMLILMTNQVIVLHNYMSKHDEGSNIRVKKEEAISID